MHLLLAQKGSLSEGEEAIDLGQSPGDIIFLSAADTELSSVAQACQQCVDLEASVRIASLMQLTHPMSMDVYCETTVSKAKVIVVRALGGESYWQYGLEKLRETAQENDIRLIVLPGDDKAEAGLLQYNSVAQDVMMRVWEYLNEGGPQNMENLLLYLGFLLDRHAEPPAAVPLMKAGLWYPGLGICELDALREKWAADQPVVAINFYRALVQSGSLQPIEAMVSALANEGMNALPVFISSLKDPVSIASVRTAFDEVNPAVVLNTTGFAVSSPTGDHVPTVLEEGQSQRAEDVRRNLASETKVTRREHKREVAENPRDGGARPAYNEKSRGSQGRRNEAH